MQTAHFDVLVSRGYGEQNKRIKALTLIANYFVTEVCAQQLVWEDNLFSDTLCN